MQMSTRFALNRDGRLIGPPRVTYATHDVPQKTRDVYRDAIALSVGAPGALVNEEMRAEIAQLTRQTTPAGKGRSK